MFHNYSGFAINSQPKQQYYHTHRHYSECRPHARCKNHQTCKTCRAIWAKEQIQTRTAHLSARDVSRFKHAYYITINPTWFNTDISESSLTLDAHVRSLIKSKRSKRSLLHGGEYLFVKEISHSEKLGYHAHYNLILLTDTPTAHHELNGYRYHVETIRRDLPDNLHKKFNDKNPLIQNIRNILSYSLKADKNRMEIEQNTQLSKGVHDLLFSDLFKVKSEKLAKSFPIHIKMKNPAIIELRKAIKHAREVHRCYKFIHSKAKAITIHKHALKTARQIARIEAKIKAITRKGRPKKPKLHTHSP